MVQAGALFGSVWRGWLMVLAAMFALAFAAPAQAQTNQYTNATSGSIVDSTSCSTTLSRTFSVGTSYIVSDVNLGVFLTHTYRSDLRITLTSPQGTTVAIMTNTAGSGDNLNDLFDDEAATAISAHSANGTDSTTAPPPYSHSFRPTGVLTDFDGENAQGTWTMVICDSVAQDTGTFTRADLYVTQAPTNYTDLSVNNVLGGGSANTGDTITYTVSVTNSASATLAASGVVVRDLLPSGLTFVSASGFGSYNSGTGDWTVGSVPIGTTRTLTITATITAASGTTITNVAEVTAQGQTDLDSTPNNGATAEDDYRATSFTVGSRIAGTPPNINSICSAAGVGTTLLDWNNHSWTSGSSTGSAAVANLGTVNFNVSTQGTYNAPLALTSDNTGGFSASQLSLFQSIEYTNQSQSTTTTATLPNAVPGVQFTIFDVDFAANDFADKLTVTGSYNGSAVSPTLTNGTANYITGGNVAIGDVASGSTSANGNVVITFSAPVDTITVVYGNHTTAPADPDGQAISIYDFTFCRPQANLSVTKISSVLDDYVSASNPKSLPGALVRYCITVTNTGSGTATGVSVNDPLPTDVTYVANSLLSGTSCGTAATVEDDDASDGTETDGVIMSSNGTTVAGTRASLPANQSVSMVFHATIN